MLCATVFLFKVRECVSIEKGREKNMRVSVRKRKSERESVCEKLNECERERRAHRPFSISSFLPNKRGFFLA